jgi:hypothetical protein
MNSSKRLGQEVRLRHPSNGNKTAFGSLKFRSAATLLCWRFPNGPSRAIAGHTSPQAWPGVRASTARPLPKAAGRAHPTAQHQLPAIYEHNEGRDFDRPRRAYLGDVNWRPVVRRRCPKFRAGNCGRKCRAASRPISARSRRTELYMPVATSCRDRDRRAHVR